MEFTIASNEMQKIVIRNSKLAGPRRSASRWINWHRKTIPIAHPLRSTRDIRKNWYISLNKSGRHAPMKLQSDFREAVTSMHRLHRESGEERPEPTPFYKYQRWHSSSSSSSTSWSQWNENWWSSIFFSKNCCSKIVYSLWQSAATDGGVNRTPSHVTFSSVCTHV